ncbi:MAG: biopolymer transporter ExbD [Alphaproteobacteria bacterium]|nr:biopolymer transporter ExbD [Alphaproteobacteria bacterium]MCL2889704.1 biopolymer transporter ExbD [Alphaproteobacteria bacterium]
MARRNSLRHESTLSLTPMIDIMTVLLAVFMVTAPLLSTAIDLELPKAGGVQMAGDQALQVSVDKAGRYFFGETQMNVDDIVKKMVAMRGENPQLAIMINGDQGASYGAVMGLMGALKDAGFQRVGLRTRVRD